MKKVIFLFLILFSTICIHSCTNDEGSEDLDLLTPEDEKEIIKDTDKRPK